MPKKFVGMNSKALEAKARRDIVKQEADAKKQKAIEDELWRDDDKNNIKKQKRKASLINQFFFLQQSVLNYLMKFILYANV